MERILYQVKRTRNQKAQVLINMGLACLFYVAAFYAYEWYTDSVLIAGTDRLLVDVSLAGASIILFAFAFWSRRNPATYSAIITSTRFKIDYPGSKQWSFDVAIDDIKRFESRATISHAGSGIVKTGVLLKDNTFHHICLNYFNGTGSFRDLFGGGPIADMYKAVKQINPSVSFPKTLNKKVEGFLKRDYEE